MIEWNTTPKFDMKKSRMWRDDNIMLQDIDKYFFLVRINLASTYIWVCAVHARIWQRGIRFCDIYNIHIHMNVFRGDENVCECAYIIFLFWLHLRTRRLGIIYIVFVRMWLAYILGVKYCTKEYKHTQRRRWLSENQNACPRILYTRASGCVFVSYTPRNVLLRFFVYIYL